MTRQATNVLYDAMAYLSGDHYWKDKIFTSQIPGRVKYAQQQLNNIFMLDSDAPDMRSSIVNATNELVVRIA
ncbi:hypothetical protein D3C72_1811560 [compost metagenome]